MDPGNEDIASDIFPMAIACTGCATRYKIDRPRAFDCPHCGNHLQILGNGKVEITPKRSYEKEIEKIEELPPEPTTVQQAKEIIEEERRSLNLKDKGAMDPSDDLTQGPKEKVVEIKVGKRSNDDVSEKATSEGPILSSDIPEAQALQAEIKKKENRLMELKREQARLARRNVEEDMSRHERSQMEKKYQDGAHELVREQAQKPIMNDGDEQELLQKQTRIARRNEEDEQELSISVGRIPAGKQDAWQASQRPMKPIKDVIKTALPLDAESMSDEVIEKVAEDRGRDDISSTDHPDERHSTPPTIPSYYQRSTRGLAPNMDPEKKRNMLIVLGVVAILILATVIYAIIQPNEFSVSMPSERIGDRGTYDVEGNIWISSPDGISTDNGLMQDLKIKMDGLTTYQVNETTVVSDGFGIDRDVIDKYLWQDLGLSGSAVFLGLKTEISDAGSLETKSSSYTCLVTNESVLTSVYNDLEIDIPSQLSIDSIDNGIYYSDGEGRDYNLYDLREREYSLGDEGDLAGGQLRWKAEEAEKVYKWECLRLHITENNSDSNWVQFSADVWVANECSLPVKIRIHTKLDTSELSPTQQLLLKFVSSSNGIIELDYVATMKGYKRGDRSIPWDLGGDDNSVDEREGVSFSNDWMYGPLIQKNTTSFDPKFSAEAAAEFAVNKSNDLASFVSRHEDEVYLVDGTYSVLNGTQYWEMFFGYQLTGLNANARGYNITVKKVDDEMRIHSDPGEEDIANPSNSRDDIERAMDIADSTDIYKEMKLLAPLFNEDRIMFEDRSAGEITFQVQNNFLHTGLTLSSSFNPFIQNSIPSGYGFYLQRAREDGDKYYFREGMIDSNNGRAIYQIDHYQRTQF